MDGVAENAGGPNREAEEVAQRNQPEIAPHLAVAEDAGACPDRIPQTAAGTERRILIRLSWTWLLPMPIWKSALRPTTPRQPRTRIGRWRKSFSRRQRARPENAARSRRRWRLESRGRIAAWRARQCLPSRSGRSEEHTSE